MHMQWNVDDALEDQGFLLVDAKNIFNLQSPVMMLWVVRHYWPSGAIFVFNCYKQWGTLVVSRTWCTLCQVGRE